MKTRSGFVSNSSSTSFTIIATVDAYSQVYDSMDKEAKELMNKTWGNKEPFVIGGITFIDLSYIDNDRGYWQCISDKYDREGAYDIGLRIIDALKKNPNAYVNAESY